MGCIAPAGRSDIGLSATAQQPDRRVADGSQHLRDGAAADLGAILVEGDITHPMALGLQVPMAAHEGQQARRSGLLGHQTGEQEAHVALGGAPLPCRGEQTGDLRDAGEGRGARQVGV